jgi:hypothetical protein
MSYRSRSGGTRQIPRTARFLLVAGSELRIAYGAGALLQPSRMASAGLAPKIHSEADPRLLLRAFGGHQVVAGSLTLCATRDPRVAELAALLSLLVDTFDVASAALEVRSRGGGDPTVTGGIVLSGVGMATFAGALWSLRQSR